MIRRLYLWLRWLFPRGFRDRFEQEMLDTADQLDREANGFAHAVAAVWDLVLSAIALRFARDEAPAPPTHQQASSMESLRQDIRFALRGLVRDPAFSLFAIATLAIGIGANAAMFGIVDRLLLRGPDHVRNPGEVVRVYVSHEPRGQRRFTGSWVGHVTYDLIKRNTKAFTLVANYTSGESTLGRGATTRTLLTSNVSEEYFDLLGVRPEVGRFIDAADNNPDGAATVAVLSHALWKRDFGARNNVVGETIVIGDVPHTIIGVAPAGFTGATLEPVEAWMPMNLVSPRVIQDWKTGWNGQWMKVIGRLAPGYTTDQANAELTRAFRLAYTGNEVSMRAATLTTAGLNATDTGSEATESRVARWLMGVSVVMLLIVCANVINLLLARAMRRTREIAIRLALGAGPGRLRRMLIIESVMLGAGGAVLGLVLAFIIGGVARRSLLSEIAWSSSPVDGRVLAFSVGIALAAGVLVGLIPAIRAGATSLMTPLKSGSGDGGGHRSHLRNSLTIAQAAMSVALLVGAGLFIRSLHKASTLPLGIEADRALIVELRRASLASMPNGPEKDVERARRRGFGLMAAEQLRGVAGVTHAALAVGLPFGNRFTVTVRVPGRDSMPTLKSGGPSVSAVSSDYFAASGTRILSGRPFTPADRAGSERITIVSATMAKTVWPNVNPIGQCLSIFNDSLPCARVVGVAEDTHRGALREDPSMHYYIPAGQEVGIGGAVLVVRGDGDPRRLVPAVRRELLRMDPSITYADIAVLQDRIDPLLQPWKLGTAVLMAAGLLALLVAVAGIYSVTSYLVTMRRREIGVRVALGASAGQVLRLVLRTGFFTAVAGIAIGSAIALATGRFLEPLLFDQSPRDPVVFAGVALALIGASLLASLVPGIRANQIDPVEALRSD